MGIYEYLDSKLCNMVKYIFDINKIIEKCTKMIIHIVALQLYHLCLVFLLQKKTSY